MRRLLALAPQRLGTRFDAECLDMGAYFQVRERGGLRVRHWSNCFDRAASFAPASDNRGETQVADEGFRDWPRTQQLTIFSRFPSTRRVALRVSTTSLASRTMAS